MTADDRDDELSDELEDKHEPLFRMFLRFTDVFANRAIDKLDITDEEAERVAMVMEKTETPMGGAYAYLMRSIAQIRRMRQINHMVSAIWAHEGATTPVPMSEIAERYAKIPKGDA